MDNIKSEVIKDLMRTIFLDLEISKSLTKNVELLTKQPLTGDFLFKNLDFFEEFLYKLPPIYFNTIYTRAFTHTIYIGNSICDENIYKQIATTFLFKLEEKHLENLDFLVETSSDSAELAMEVYSQLDIKKFGVNNILYNLYCEVLTDRLFRDYGHNFKIYIKSLKIFNENFKNEISTKLQENLNILFEISNKLQKINATDLENQYADFKKLYAQLKNSKINFKAILYDAYDEAKTIYASSYSKSLSKLKDFPFKTKNGVKIYYRNNKNFKAFVSCLSLNRVSLRACNLKLGGTKRYNDIISTSYVSNDSLLTFKDLKHQIALGYFEMSPYMIIHGMSMDSYSNVVILSDELPCSISTNMIDFISPDEMLKLCAKNKTYSEFCLIYPDKKLFGYKMHTKPLLNNKEILKPSCVFCLNEPTESEIEFAKINNLPIFVSEVENYEYHGETLKSIKDNFEKCF